MLDVRNIIVDAYKTIGEIGDQEALDGTRAQVGLDLLNELVSDLNLENYFAFTTQTITYSPSTAQSSYTIGVNTGTASTSAVEINADRPANIMRAYLKNRGNASIYSEITQIGTQDIPLFTIDGTSAPTYMAYRSTYPLGTIEFNCSVGTSYDIQLIYSKPIPRFDFNDELEIPYEYEPALKYALAYLIAKRYGNPAEVINDMRELRTEYLQKIKDNTQRKSNPIHHLSNDRSRVRNILNMGDF
jgi:hypothetical protein